MTDTTALPAPLVPADHPRTEAAKAGQLRYRDGVPCVHGHTGQRYTRNANCVECQRIRCAQDRARIRALLKGGRP